MTLPRYLALLAVFMAIPACSTPTGPPPENQGVISRIVDCAPAAVVDNGIALIPAVNDCVVMPTNWTGCLLGLINPVKGITEDVLACATRASARSHARSADTDPTSMQAATHASDFLKERGYKFADEVKNE